MTTSSVMSEMGAQRVREGSQGLRYRHLLCPIDLSETSGAALDVAAELARATGAEITALFVFPAVRAYAADATDGPASMLPEPGVRSVVSKDVEEFVRAARLSGATVRARMEVGDPAAEILAAAAETRADAIVLGTHGRSGAERWLLGSVAQKVLRGAHCPVLSVAGGREGAQASRDSGGPILCALDLLDGSPATLRHALYLGRTTGRPVAVVHVIEDPWQFELAAVHAQIDWSGLRRDLEEEAVGRLRRVLLAECGTSADVERLIVSGKPYREVLRMVEEHGASVVVMGRHGHPGARGGLFGSNAEHVMRAAKCPVLTVCGA